MAARRLITVLIVLLVLSSVAAALVPIERRSSSTSTTTTTTTTTGTTTTAALSAFVQRTVDAAAAKPETIRIVLGERLGLTVRSREPAQVGVPAFGELEEVDPAAPAHFDLLPFHPGRYPVRLLKEGKPARTIATIAVSPAPQRSGGADRRQRESRAKRTRPAS